MLLRQLTGDVLRQRRLAQGLTMREVSARARVSLGYISEVERGHKEASSELLSALCSALGVPLSQVLRDVATLLEVDETAAVAGSVESAGVGGHTAGGTADREPVYAA